VAGKVVSSKRYQSTGIVFVVVLDGGGAMTESIANHKKVGGGVGGKKRAKTETDTNNPQRAKTPPKLRIYTDTKTKNRKQSSVSTAGLVVGFFASQRKTSFDTTEL
jgi:hypothetical protein